MSFSSGWQNIKQGVKQGVRQGFSGFIEGFRDHDELEPGRFEQEDEPNAPAEDDEDDEIRVIGQSSRPSQPTREEQLRQRKRRLQEETSGSSSRGGRGGQTLGEGPGREMAKHRHAARKSSGGNPIRPSDPTAPLDAPRGGAWQTDHYDDDRGTPTAAQTAASSSGFRARHSGSSTPLPNFVRHGKREAAEDHYLRDAVKDTGRGPRGPGRGYMSQAIPPEQYYHQQTRHIDGDSNHLAQDDHRAGPSRAKGKAKAGDPAHAIEISEGEGEGEGEEDDPISEFPQEAPFQLTEKQAKKVPAMGRKGGKKATPSQSPAGLTSTPNGRGAKGKDRAPSPSQPRLPFTSDAGLKSRRAMGVRVLSAIEIPTKRVLFSNVELTSTEEQPLVCVYNKDDWTIVRHGAGSGRIIDYVGVRIGNIEQFMREPRELEKPATLVFVLRDQLFSRSRVKLTEFWSSVLSHIDPDHQRAVLIEFDRDRQGWRDDLYDDVWDRLKMIEGQKMERWKAGFEHQWFNVNQRFSTDRTPPKAGPGARSAPAPAPVPSVRPKPVKAAAMKRPESGPIEVPDSPEALSKKPERTEGPVVRRSARQSGVGPGPILPPPRPPPEGPDSEIIAAWPPEGGPGAITLTRGDFGRLREGEFLNDTLIEFGLRYYFHTILQNTPQLASRVHIFNSFFFTKLTKRASKGGNRDVEAHDSVRKWTKGFDIFSKEYVVVPINEHMHWYFLVFVRPAEILRRPRPIQPPPARATRGSLRKGELEPMGTPKEEMPPTLSNEERKRMSPEQAHAPGLVSYHSDDLVDMLMDSDDERAKADRRAKESTQEWAPIEGSSHGDITMQEGDPDATLDDTDQTAMLFQRITGGALRGGSHDSSSPEPADSKAQAKANGASTRSTSPTSGAEGVGDTSATAAAKELDRSQPSYAKEAYEAPHAFSFDSLGSAHTTPCKTVWRYLAQEARAKKGIEDTAHDQVHNLKATVPEQPNFCDCGVYLIHAFKMFFADPERMTRWILNQNSADEAAKVWDSESVRSMRQEMRVIVESLRDPYRKHKAKRDEEAAEAKRKRQEEKTAQQKDETGKNDDVMDEDIPVPSTAESVVERPPPAAEPPASQETDDSTVVVQRRPARKYGQGKKATNGQPAAPAAETAPEIHTIADDDEDDDDDPMAIKPNDVEGSVRTPGRKKRNREAADADTERREAVEDPPKGSKYFEGGSKGKGTDRQTEARDVEQNQFEKDAALLDAPVFTATPGEPAEPSKRQRTSTPGPRFNGRPGPILDHLATSNLAPLESNVLMSNLPPPAKPRPPTFNGDLNPAEKPTQTSVGRRRPAHGNDVKNPIALLDDDDGDGAERPETRSRRRQ